ncbi:nascent polypeptide-associated complex protein [Candidatus Bathyarchaeota archaeon]|nr:nascent polypeptide-associated complex protein [Candidatus Bathyarchaeota archaeon]
MGELARIDSRKARRMMAQMGLKMDELSDINRVILQGDEREIIIEQPVVTVIDLKGQRMFQIAGGSLKERSLKREPSVPEEDVLLVAEQAGVSAEMARRALLECEGDLAKAILSLRKG